MNRAPLVAVIGKGRDCPPDVLELAIVAGGVVAKLGGVVVTGGLGGVMRGAAEGALAQGGQVVGLVPLGRDAEAFTDARALMLPTGLPEVYRNALTASVADLGIVLPGSHGTVQEGMALAERGVPLIGLGEHDGPAGPPMPWRSAVLARDVRYWARNEAALTDALKAALADLPLGEGKG